MYRLIVKSKFSSAHNLKGYKGKCENLHGHNWLVEASVASKDLNNIGLVLDFKILKEKLDEVLDALDHKYLNEIDFFKKNNPSSENIAKYIHDNLEKELSQIKLEEIRVWETDTNCAIYSE